MRLYAGFDLHSRSSHLAVLDQNGKKVFKAKLDNDTQLMTLALEPYREKLVAIAVESTFNTGSWMLLWKQVIKCV
jgi:transposase